MASDYSFKSFGTQKNKVVFIFTALATQYWLYYPLIWIFIKAGYAVIVYDVHSRIVLDGDIENFLGISKAIVHSVSSQILTLKKQGIESFFTFGVSMGTLFAMRSAIDNPDVKKVVINLTYGSLADNVWSWVVLRKVKEKSIKKGLSKQEVDKMLEWISPIQMAASLKGKKILLYLAKRDRVLLFEQSLQFKDALDKAKVEYTYHQKNIFGHILSGTINNLRYSLYLNFLSD